MIEDSDLVDNPPIYEKGDIVWVKLSSYWWPGEVKNEEDLPSDLLTDFKKPPLVIVKFFEEDSYEYIKHWSNIYPYDCDKKNDFIKKGMAGFRGKLPHMATFPRDVTTAEEKTNGDPNILSQPEFLPNKKINYDEIFGTPSPKKSSKKTTLKESNNTPLVTHRRFLGNDDYKAFVLVQEPCKDRQPDSDDEDIRKLNEEPQEVLTCKSCNFSTKRLGVLLIHTKLHLEGSVYVTTKRKNKKPNHVDAEAGSSTANSTEVDAEVAEATPPRPRKKKIAKNESKPADVFSNLLDEWNDSDEEMETPAKQQKTNNSNSVFENDDDSCLFNSQEDELTINSTLQSSKGTDKLKATSPNKNTQEDIKNCFDFDEEEEDDEFLYPASTGRKIPRVIPEKPRASISELLELGDKEDDESKVQLEKQPESNSHLDEEDPRKKEILRVSQSFNRTPVADDTLDSTFKDLMEETEVPVLDDLTHSLKSEQNFHDVRTIKFPDKGGTAVKTPVKGGTSKKRFVTSFEDFEAGFRKVDVDATKEKPEKDVNSNSDAQQDVTDEIQNVEHLTAQQTEISHTLNETSLNPPPDNVSDGAKKRRKFKQLIIEEDSEKLVDFYKDDTDNEPSRTEESPIDAELAGIKQDLETTDPKIQPLRETEARAEMSLEQLTRELEGSNISLDLHQVEPVRKNTAEITLNQNTKRRSSRLRGTPTLESLEVNLELETKKSKSRRENRKTSESKSSQVDVGIAAKESHDMKKEKHRHKESENVKITEVIAESMNIETPLESVAKEGPDVKKGKSRSRKEGEDRRQQAIAEIPQKSISKESPDVKASELLLKGEIRNEDVKEQAVNPVVIETPPENILKESTPIKGGKSRSKRETRSEVAKEQGETPLENVPKECPDLKKGKSRSKKGSESYTVESVVKETVLENTPKENTDLKKSKSRFKKEQVTEQFAGVVGMKASPLNITKQSVNLKKSKSRSMSRESDSENMKEVIEPVVQGILLENAPKEQLKSLSSLNPDDNVGEKAVDTVVEKTPVENVSKESPHLKKSKSRSKKSESIKEQASLLQETPLEISPKEERKSISQLESEDGNVEEEAAESVVQGTQVEEVSKGSPVLKKGKSRSKKKDSDEDVKEQVIVPVVQESPFAPKDKSKSLSKLELDIDHVGEQAAESVVNPIEIIFKESPVPKKGKSRFKKKESESGNIKEQVIEPVVLETPLEDASKEKRASLSKVEPESDNVGEQTAELAGNLRENKLTESPNRKKGKSRSKKKESETENIKQKVMEPVVQETSVSGEQLAESVVKETPIDNIPKKSTDFTKTKSRLKKELENENVSERLSDLVIREAPLVTDDKQHLRRGRSRKSELFVPQVEEHPLIEHVATIEPIVGSNLTLEQLPEEDSVSPKSKKRNRQKMSADSPPDNTKEVVEFEDGRTTRSRKHRKIDDLREIEHVAASLQDIKQVVEGEPSSVTKIPVNLEEEKPALAAEDTTKERQKSDPEIQESPIPMEDKQDDKPLNEPQIQTKNLVATEKEEISVKSARKGRSTRRSVASCASATHLNLEETAEPLGLALLPEDITSPTLRRRRGRSQRLYVDTADTLTPTSQADNEASHPDVLEAAKVESIDESNQSLQSEVKPQEQEIISEQVAATIEQAPSTDIIDASLQQPADNLVVTSTEADSVLSVPLPDSEQTVGQLETTADSQATVSEDGQDVTKFVPSILSSTDSEAVSTEEVIIPETCSVPAEMLMVPLEDIPLPEAPKSAVEVAMLDIPVEDIPLPPSPPPEVRKPSEKPPATEITQQKSAVVETVSEKDPQPSTDVSIVESVVEPASVGELGQVEIPYEANSKPELSDGSAQNLPEESKDVGLESIPVPESVNKHTTDESFLDEKLDQELREQAESLRSELNPPESRQDESTDFLLEDIPIPEPVDKPKTGEALKPFEEAQADQQFSEKVQSLDFEDTRQESTRQEHFEFLLEDIPIPEPVNPPESKSYFNAVSGDLSLQSVTAESSRQFQLDSSPQALGPNRDVHILQENVNEGLEVSQNISQVCDERWLSSNTEIATNFNLEDIPIPQLVEQPLPKIKKSPRKQWLKMSDFSHEESTQPTSTQNADTTLPLTAMQVSSESFEDFVQHSCDKIASNSEPVTYDDKPEESGKPQNRGIVCDVIYSRQSEVRRSGRLRPSRRRWDVSEPTESRLIDSGQEPEDANLKVQESGSKPVIEQEQNERRGHSRKKSFLLDSPEELNASLAFSASSAIDNSSETPSSSDVHSEALKNVVVVGATLTGNKDSDASSIASSQSSTNISQNPVNLSYQDVNAGKKSPKGDKTSEGEQSVDEGTDRILENVTPSDATDNEANTSELPELVTAESGDPCDVFRKNKGRGRRRKQILNPESEPLEFTSDNNDLNNYVSTASFPVTAEVGNVHQQQVSALSRSEAVTNTAALPPHISAENSVEQVLETITSESKSEEKHEIGDEKLSAQDAPLLRRGRSSKYSLDSFNSFFDDEEIQSPPVTLKKNVRSSFNETSIESDVTLPRDKDNMSETTDSGIILPLKKSKRINEISSILASDSFSTQSDSDLSFRSACDDSFMSSSMMRNHIDRLIDEMDSVDASGLAGLSSSALDIPLFSQSSETERSAAVISANLSDSKTVPVPPKKKKIDLPQIELQTDDKLTESLPQAPKKKMQKLFESTQTPARSVELPQMSPLAKKKSFYFQHDFEKFEQSLLAKDGLASLSSSEDSNADESIDPLPVVQKRKPSIDANIPIQNENLDIQQEVQPAEKIAVIQKPSVDADTPEQNENPEIQHELQPVEKISENKEGISEEVSTPSIPENKIVLAEVIEESVQPDLTLPEPPQEPNIIPEAEIKNASPGPDKSLVADTDINQTSDSFVLKKEDAGLDLKNPVVTEPELIPLSVAPTVMSEKDLDDAQVEITSNKVISEKKPSNLGAFSVNFNPTAIKTETVASVKVESNNTSNTVGTEFTSKAMVKDFDNKSLTSQPNVYALKSELLDILEGNSNSSTNSSGSEQKFKTSFDNYDKKNTVQGIIDFEDAIPPQIVITNKIGAESVLLDSPKLLERLSMSVDSGMQAKPKVLTEVKSVETVPKSLASKIAKPTGLPKPGQKILIRTSRSMVAATPKTVGSKPIILSEQIIRPAGASAAVGKIAVQGLKREYEDVEDVEAAFIIPKIAKKSIEEESVHAVPPEKPVKQRASKAAGKPKILQQTIISAKGDVVPQAATATTARPVQLQSVQGQVARDDTVFDINSMPIVLSDDLLTPESIQNMPVVLSSDVLSQSTTTAPVNKTQERIASSIPKRTVVSTFGPKQIIFKTTPSSSIPLSTIKQPSKLKNVPAVAPAIQSKIAKGGTTTAFIATGTTPDGKTAKYVLVPPSVTPANTQVKAIKQTVIKNQPVAQPQPKATTAAVAATSNAAQLVGNKIMIVTNAQGQQTRVVLTPQQQKVFLQGPSAAKTKAAIKSAIPKTLLESTTGSTAAGPSGVTAKATPILSQGLPSSQPKSMISSALPAVSNPVGLLMPAVKNVKSTVPVKKVQRSAKPQKTILIKNQLGQTVRKIQGTDDADLDRQVAEQLEAIKASARLQQANKTPEIINFTNRSIPNSTAPSNRPGTIKKSYVKKVEGVKPKVTSPVAVDDTPKKSDALVPALAPLSPQSRIPQVQSQPTTQSVTKPTTVKREPSRIPTSRVPEQTSQLHTAASTKSSSRSAATVPTKGDKPSESKRAESPVRQVVIQDGLGNLTTVTVGQILAIPSETVDGQPQSYMLVTVDESGNLTPLNNDALMSLDPSLGAGGDVNNVVLQVDQGQGTVAAVKPTPETKTLVSGSPKSKLEERLKAEKPKVTSQPPSQPKSVVMELPKPPELPVAVEQQVVIGDGVVPGDAGGQQLLVTGDPVATQKFLESLSDGTTDLAGILSRAEGGSVLIQTDGQQILIRTSSSTEPALGIGGTEADQLLASHKPNQDILAAALADTDVFQSADQAVSQSIMKGVSSNQLSPGSAAGLFPMQVGNVLETSLTLGSPIMTPLEVPSTNSKKIKDEADILGQVPKNVDLPITITDPNISQTVAHQPGLMELSLPIPDTVPSQDINSPSFPYSLTTIEESVGMSQKSFNGSMPLLTEDVIESHSATSPRNDKDSTSNFSANFDSLPLLDTIESSKGDEKTNTFGSIGSLPMLSDDVVEDSGSSIGSAKLLRSSPKSVHRDIVDEGLSTLGGEMCSSLSEPPPDMFDLSSLAPKEEEISSDLSSIPEQETMSMNSENSSEIPLQPPIVASLSELKRPSDDDSEGSDEKRPRFGD